MTDEDDWTTIRDDDVFWPGPTRLPTPLAVPVPPLLPIHDLDWESFERLVLAMARSLDGGYDFRRYGRLGQVQPGLDFIAFFAERKPSVYQAKRWQGFGAGDLEDAVDRYTEGRRPFGADRIVIVVATEARDTRTIEKLAELREKHKDMEIELWDRRAISDRLRNQTDIVSTFFGPAWAAAFCTSTDPPGHVFISYVREDAERVDRLQRAFDDAGISVWRDTADLWPGQDWKLEIRRAITTGSLAFVACFSEHTQARVVSYQNEELILAVEQMRARPPGRVWLLPVRFADCQLPEFDLGSGRTLDSLQRTDLFDDRSWDRGVARLITAVRGILTSPR